MAMHSWFWISWVKLKQSLWVISNNFCSRHWHQGKNSIKYIWRVSILWRHREEYFKMCFLTTGEGTLCKLISQLTLKRKDAESYRVHSLIYSPYEHAFSVKRSTIFLSSYLKSYSALQKIVLIINFGKKHFQHISSLYNNLCDKQSGLRPLMHPFLLFKTEEVEWILRHVC